MNLIDRICQFTKSTKNNFERDQHHEIETQPADVKDEKSSEEVISPRDGMSPESAKFTIGRCMDGRQYEIQGIENQGRYFTAKVKDSRGRPVNEILVDKLTGKVQFLRSQ